MINPRTLGHYVSHSHCILFSNVPARGAGGVELPHVQMDHARVSSHLFYHTYSRLVSEQFPSRWHTRVRHLFPSRVLCCLGRLRPRGIAAPLLQSLHLSRNCCYHNECNKNAEQLSLHYLFSIGVSGTIAESLTDTQTLSSHQFSASFALLMPIAIQSCVLHGHTQSCVLHGHTQSCVLHGHTQSCVLHGHTQSCVLHGHTQSCVLHGHTQSCVLHGHTQSCVLHGHTQSCVLHGHTQSCVLHGHTPNS